MAKIDDFVGKWIVDQEASDSIEPMLKAMGVSLMIRKIAKAVKVIQEIKVDGQKFIVNNISKHAEDKTVHYMNVGERTILTNRGEKVIDNCTWDPAREFPLEIVAVLPEGKGSTVDRRQMGADNESFMQHLIYKFPEDSPEQGKQILMKRIFRKVHSKNASALSKEQLDTAIDERVNDFSRTSETTHVEHSSAQSSDSSSRSKEILAESENGITTWLIIVLCLIGMSITYFMQIEGKVEPEVAAIAYTVLVVPTILVRLFKYDVMQRKYLNPVLLVYSISIIVFAEVNYYLNDMEVANPSTIRIIALSFGLFLLGMSLVEMGSLRASLPVEAATSKLNERSRWVLIAFMLVLATVFETFSSHENTFDYLGLLLLGLFVTVRFLIFRDHGVSEMATADSKGLVSKEKNAFMQLTIPEYRIVDNIYTQYRVQVKCEEGQWAVWRRYSQFHALRTDLKRHFGRNTIPKMPPKTWFTSMDQEFIQVRRIELEQFMQELMQEPLKEDILKHKVLRKFLGLGQGRGLKQAKPKIEKVKKDPSDDPNLLSALKKVKADMQKTFDCGATDGWEFIGRRKGVQSYMKQQNGLTFTKGIGVVEAPIDVVVGYTNDNENRSKYDDLWKRDTVLAKLDVTKIGKAIGENVNHAEIVWSEFKSPFVVIGARDVVMATCSYKQDNGVVVKLFVLVEGYKKPVDKYLRANVLGAGIRLEPMPGEPEKCIMANVQCMDPTGSIPGWVVKTVAPERCEMSAVLSNLVKDRSLWAKYETQNKAETS